VNNTLAIVPQALITHVGGRIEISGSVFTGISLSSQAVISFGG
jgi:hypothetical protein